MDNFPAIRKRLQDKLLYKAVGGKRQGGGEIKIETRAIDVLLHYKYQGSKCFQ